MTDRKLRAHERKKPAISFTPDDWGKLRAELQLRPEPEACVLLVIAATGLRIADVLAIEIAPLRSAVERDGVLDIVQKGGRKRQIPVAGAKTVWVGLLQRVTDGATVAAWICPASNWGSKGGGGAYQRCNRYLRALCAELDIDGTPHLHRMRRTVATRALAHTHDIHLVSQLMGHRKISSTQAYTDELRAGEVSDLHAELWNQ